MEDSVLPRQITDLLDQYGTKKLVRTHETLIQAGEACKQVYFVIKGGFLRRFYNEHSATYHTISFHFPAHRPFLTVNKSYFAGKVSMYEIKAFQASEVLVFEQALIEEMNQSHDFLREFYQAKILEALIFENEFKARLISYSSQEFYQYLCETLPVIIQYVPSKYIAEVMGISPEWLSKLKQKIG